MNRHYDNLDGFRFYACICIVIMHVFKNGNYSLYGPIFDRVIPSFKNLVFLFMMISSFSLCCGYYEKFKDGTVKIDDFYIKRYKRIWPFFALLCTIELIFDRSINTLYEWIADLTLMYGFLPNANISVVGVGWFLGVIFAFYVMFPFFCFLINDKRRAWLSFSVSVIFNVLCQAYFFDETHIVEGFRSRSNIVFCFMFFLAGGLIYLYQEKLIAGWEKTKWLVITSLLICVGSYYLLYDSEFLLLSAFSLILLCGVCGRGTFEKKLFQNKFVKDFCPISMEVYLCHMFVFRFVERLNLVHPTKYETVNYLIVCFITICGASFMAKVIKFFIPIFFKRRFANVIK